MVRETNESTIWYWHYISSLLNYVKDIPMTVKWSEEIRKEIRMEKVLLLKEKRRIIPATFHLLLSTFFRLIHSSFSYTSLCNNNNFCLVTSTSELSFSSEMNLFLLFFVVVSLELTSCVSQPHSSHRRFSHFLSRFPLSLEILFFYICHGKK
jgi:hypothetical protein